MEGTMLKDLLDGDLDQEFFFFDAPDGTTMPEDLENVLAIDYFIDDDDKLVVTEWAVLRG